MTEAFVELIDGLCRPQKTIPPKYFYDERGSQLFEEITALPEYYLTDAELEIMREYVDEMTALIGERASLIEYGSGSSLKTRILLEHLEAPAAYVPVDISAEHLFASAQRIRREFPGIAVHPVVADFTRPFDVPAPAVTPVKNVVYFPGSTIGNFERDDAVELLRIMHGEAGDRGELLIGVDLQKDPGIIDSAYNDEQGVTAEFNLNMLRHINDAFGADFDVDAFEHRAEYDEDAGRVVLELVSQEDQTVSIGDAEIAIADGEAILTEYSHKYTLDGFAAMALEAGLEVAHVWTDADGLFSVQRLTVAGV